MWQLKPGMSSPFRRTLASSLPVVEWGKWVDLEAPQGELPAANSWEARLRCACYDNGRQRNHNQHACLCRSLQAPHPAGVVDPSSDRMSMNSLSCFKIL